jgi:stress response protein YsnF
MSLADIGTMSERRSPERLNLGESERVRIPLAAERLQVSTRLRRTGIVRVSTRVERRTAVVDPPLRRQRIDIRRRRVDRFVDRPPDVRRVGNTLIVPIVEEVVITRLKVVEEVAITLQRSIERRPQRVELRRERAVVERLAINGNPRKNRS